MADWRNCFCLAVALTTVISPNTVMQSSTVVHEHITCKFLRPFNPSCKQTPDNCNRGSTLLVIKCVVLYHTERHLNCPSTEEQLNGACGGADANDLSGAEEGDDEEEEVPVDENLFMGEDLEELDEELNTLALED